MLQKPLSCKGCPLHTKGLGFMEPTGEGYYGVMIIGEALGAAEAEAGKPFMGAAGKQLQEAIDWAGLKREGFIIANAVWCQPPGNGLEGEEYEEGATAHCYAAHLGPLLERTQPKVLMPLGNVPMRVLLGEKGILKRRGYVYRRGKALVLPSIHPSFIQRGNTKWIQVLVHDLQRAVELAREGWTPPPTHYLLDPPLEAVEEWARRAIASGAPIAYDIETPGKEEDEGESKTDTDDKPKPIIRIGFSCAEFDGLSISFAKRHHALIRQILSSPNDKIVWNGAFDNPHLYAHGFEIGGTIHDGMVAWHVLHSNLPKGLGFVATMVCPEQPPWKHLSHEMPAYYNATDADVEWRATHRIWQLLKDLGLWPVYEHHVLRLDAIFARMSKAGMPTDPAIRALKAAELTKMLEAVDAEIQEVVPTEVRPHHPRDGYKKLQPPAEPDPSTTWVQLENGLWAKQLPFVPSAGKTGGLARYQDFLHHAPVIKEGKRTTDESALYVLMKRYPEDRLYPLIAKRREIEKLGSTYVGWHNADSEGVRGPVSGGIQVSPDGRAHPTFTHNPSTLRTSCVAPNLQQIPRAHGLAAMVKAFFVAPPGYALAEVDYSGIEALLVGHFARSERYMRLARLGVHDFVNAYALWQLDHILTEADMPQLSWTDDALAAYFGELKRKFKAERDVRKRMVHGRNYLMGWKEGQSVILKEQHKVLPAKLIKDFLRFYDELFPEIGEWQRELLKTVGGVEERDRTGGGQDSSLGASAGGLLRGLRPGVGGEDRGITGPDSPTAPFPLSPYGTAGSGWIRNPFGYLHRYNRAVEWERIGGLWQWKPGADAARAVAFLPQSTAAGVIKEAMLRVEDRDPELLDALRLVIHDSLVIEAREELIAELAQRLARIMQEPNPELDGLWVGTEAKIGKSWLVTE